MSANQTLIILTPAFAANESDRESIWLPAKQSLIRCLNRNFPELEVIILSFQYPSTKHRYHWEGNQVIAFGGNNRTRGRQWWVWWQVYREMRRINKQKHVIAILSFWCAECCFVGHYFGLLYHLKHFCWICGQDAKKENQFVKRIRPRPEELVAMSDFLMRSFLQNHGIKPAWLIPDGLDTALFSSEPPETGREKSREGAVILKTHEKTHTYTQSEQTSLNEKREGTRDIDIIGAGGLSPLKQYHIFIDVIAEIVKSHPTVRAVLCGEGEQMDSLHHQIERLGLSNHIKLTGSLPHKAVLQLMQRAKILLHPSRYEGFGNVCLEALYAGTEVISFVQPVDAPVPHWHIAIDPADMLKRSLQLLSATSPSYEPVLVYDMDDSARKFMTLFTAEKNSLTSTRLRD